MIDSCHLSALGQVAKALVRAGDEWWIVGSAAVALHGGDPGRIADIDVIVSRADLDALYDKLPLSDTPDEGKAIFRSQRFGLWSEPTMPAEFMAGLEVLREGEWLAVQPRTRKGIDIGGVQVFVPERAELIEILESFGREKDLRRAEALRKI